MPDDQMLEVWKVTVDVQKHFNDLGLRVRSLAVAILAALLAAAGYALKDHETVNVLGEDKSLAGLILLAALLCWLVCYVMDRLWYHRLLQAAVDHGMRVEEALKPKIPTIDLTTAINKASPIMGLRAGHRLSLFYGTIATILIAGAGFALQAERYYWLGWASTLLLVAGVRLLVYWRTNVIDADQ